MNEGCLPTCEYDHSCEGEVAPVGAENVSCQNGHLIFQLPIANGLIYKVLIHQLI